MINTNATLEQLEQLKLNGMAQAYRAPLHFHLMNNPLHMSYWPGWQKLKHKTAPDNAPRCT